MKTQGFTEAMTAVGISSRKRRSACSHAASSPSGSEGRSERRRTSSFHGLGSSTDPSNRSARPRDSTWRQSNLITCRAPGGVFPACLTVHAAGEHLDRRALLRIRKIEADDLDWLARRGVVEFDDRAARRLEKAVVGFEELNRPAFHLEDEAPGRHHP